MNRNSQKLRNLLLNLINKQKQDLTGLVSDPDVNFTRNRKIPYENMILSLLTMEGATLTNDSLVAVPLPQHHQHLFSRERKSYQPHWKIFFKSSLPKQPEAIIIGDINF